MTQFSKNNTTKNASVVALCFDVKQIKIKFTVQKV